jgi:repressor of nif and glnA expression
LSVGIDNKTRLEILRLIAESDRAIGAETLTGRLALRGINLTVDAVRYHLRVLDEQGFTSRLSNQGRVLTDAGSGELERSLVDTRMRYGLARHESLAQQVTFDPAKSDGKVASTAVTFPVEQLTTVLKSAAKACHAGLCISDRGMIVRAGERFGSMIVPNGKAGLAMVSTSTIDGFLLSRGLLFRPIFGGIVEVAAWRPYRFIDLVDYGRASRDPVELLIRPGSTRINSIIERGHGLLMADVREMVGVARDKVIGLLGEVKSCDMGGVLMVGQVGQPILGVPVQRYTFGVAMVAGVNPLLASYEIGVLADFMLNETLVDYSSLQPIDTLLPELDGDGVAVSGKLLCSTPIPEPVS